MLRPTSVRQNDLPREDQIAARENLQAEDKRHTETEIRVGRGPAADRLRQPGYPPTRVTISLRRSITLEGPMDHYSADVRYGLRQLRLNPMFTLIAVLARALGIGVKAGLALRCNGNSTLPSISTMPLS